MLKEDARQLLVDKGYVLLNQEWEGGLAIVVAANHQHVDIAVKISKQALDQSVIASEFENLVEIQNITKHEKILSLFGIWQAQIGDRLHLVTNWELADDTLSDVAKRYWDSGCGICGIPVDELADYMKDVVVGINYMHLNDITHCDIKPANILRFHGKGRLGDLGAIVISKLTAAPGQASKPVRAFTPAFAPPLPERAAGKWFDIYCLASTYFWLRSGMFVSAAGTHVGGTWKFQGDLLDRFPELHRVSHALHEDVERRSRLVGDVVEWMDSVCQLAVGERGSCRRLEQNSIGMQLSLIPAGSFMMGSNVTEKGRQQTGEIESRRVRIGDPFYIGVHPVTIGQYAKFINESNDRSNDADLGKAIGSSSRQTGSEFSWRSPGFSQDSNHPVVLVSWDDATRFCDWLSKKEGRKYRLPKEEEWEFACRASPLRYRVFGVGNGVSLSANDANFDGRFPYGSASKGECRGGTTSVGAFDPNSWGLFDMHGNVWEWTHRHDGTKNQRIVRGGAWKSPGTDCRSARRGSTPRDECSNCIGFRIVREL